MKFLTNKQIFNKVKKHLLNQGEQAKNLYSCLYRTQNGLKCAIGCLISDELYSDEIECGILDYNDYNGIWSGDINNNCLLVQTLYQSGIDLSNKETVELLNKLQSIHDSFTPYEWENELNASINDLIER
jgi:hypothetical protein